MRTGGSFLTEPVPEDIFTREMFSDEQREIEDMVRELGTERIKPHHDELEVHDEKLSRELLREVAELGLTAIDIPEKYGGLELDKTTSALVAEAITSSGSASWVVTFSAHVGIGTLPIVYFGTEEQKAKYLPRLASAEALGAYALTEPQAGSDATHLTTTAVLSDDGKYYVLNGTKQYVTNGGWADLYIVFARLDGKITAFLVERGWPGFTIGEEEHKMGIRGSSTTGLFFDDVKVPRENLLGNPGGGLQIALNILNIGRFKLGAADLGACKSTIDHATAYALERRQFGQPVAFFDALRKKLAEMVVRTFVLDSVIYRTVGLMDERISALDPASPRHADEVMAALEEYAIEASIAKVLGSETLAFVVDQGIQIYGGYGFSEEFPLAGVYRDCRIDRIFEGTNEINRMVIYGYFLKKALMEELPLREAVRTLAEAPGTNGPLARELGAIDGVRRLALAALDEAICHYGQDLRNEQIVGEDLADLVIAYYGASSALARLRRLGEGALTEDKALRSLARLIVAHALEEASRLTFRLRPTLFGDGNGARPGPSRPAARAFAVLRHELSLPFDPIPEVRRLTDDLLDAGHDRFG